MDLPNHRPRVAAVSYLNTVPLVWGMLHGPQAPLFDLSFCVPSECADRLRAGTADIGIVPVVEVARQGLEVFPGAGIACHGPVRSILLISKVPFDQIRTLATDNGSRTSAMLARIILSRQYGAHPEPIVMEPRLEPMLAAADAALIIGDPALSIDPQSLPYRWLDLGAEWTSMTGLPMVFAVWAGRPDVGPEWAAKSFVDSYEFGHRHLDEIIAREAPLRGYPASLVHDYFTKHIVFRLGERDYAGMRLYLDYAAALEPQLLEKALV
jgi:chorismate dehydratase